MLLCVFNVDTRKFLITDMTQICDLYYVSETVLVWKNGEGWWLQLTAM